MEGIGIFRGTFLAEILIQLQTQQFDIPDLIPLEPSDEYVGELIDLEKAVFSLMHAKKHLVLSTCEYCGHTEEEQADPKCYNALKLKQQVEVLKAIGFLLVSDRLGLHDEKNIAIRKGNKVVKQQLKDQGGRLLDDLLASMFK